MNGPQGGTIGRSRSQTMNASLTDLSRSVVTAQSLEALARPLLDMLRAATGLESVYLTSVNLAAGEQQVQFALNAGALDIPEGLTVPWSDTLCKRALDEHTTVCQDVPARWGDCAAAQALGLKTYASAPVCTSGGTLVGTLCAASGQSVALSDWAQSTLLMFSKLLSQHIEREMLVQQLQTANSQLMTHALTDALTGLPNRRAVLDELERMLARCARDGIPVLVGLVDLDHFKAVNDTLGHQAGDRFLQAVAQRLHAAVRATDMVGRIGGDEFAVLGPGTLDGAIVGGADGAGAAGTAGALGGAAAVLRQRLASATVGHYGLGAEALDYAGASVGVVTLPAHIDAEAALREADAAMYADKRRRKSGGGQGPAAG